MYFVKIGYRRLVAERDRDAISRHPSLSRCVLSVPPSGGLVREKSLSGRVNSEKAIDILSEWL